MASGRDTNEQYWAEYNNLQRAKHQLLKRYLGGWYPILTRYNGKVIYLDTHAGRGRHETGQPGSAVIALTTLLQHHYREEILSGAEIVFSLVENDLENLEQLTNKSSRSDPSQSR